MSPEDDAQSLRKQLAHYKDNLRLIQERKSAYVLPSDIPLQLQKEEDDIHATIADLSSQLEDEETTNLQNPTSSSAQQKQGSVDRLRALRFIYAEISSQSLQQTMNPYLQQVDASDLTLQGSTSHIYAYTYLPRANIIRARGLAASTPVCTICLAHPHEILEKLKSSLGLPGLARLASPLGKLFPKEKEELITSCSLILRESHVICVSFSSLLLGVARDRPDLAYQVVADLMFLPMLQAHKMYGINEFTSYLSKVGDDCDAAVLQAFKKVLTGTFHRKGSSCLELTSFEDSILIQVARLFVWAVSAYYNNKESKWISIISRIFEGDSSQMEESPPVK